MSLYITSLNSGSNGNCYYISNHNEAVLIDAGISCREIEKRLQRLGLSMQKVKGVFVSHEHSDHIKGIPALAKKYQLPVFITPATLFRTGFILEKHLVNSFTASEPVTIGDLTIAAFPKAHDASDPHSFMVECNGTKVGVFTDIGTPCRNVINYFKKCNAAFLEANYDDVMLDAGTYPYYLKRRIKGGNGHLSNKQALEVFKAHKPACMTHLFLSHLSGNNNCPDLVKSLFEKHADGVDVIVASRFQETALYHIHSPEVKQAKRKQTSAPQLSLFQFPF